MWTMRCVQKIVLFNWFYINIVRFVVCFVFYHQSIQPLPLPPTPPLIVFFVWVNLSFWSSIVRNSCWVYLVSRFLSFSQLPHPHSPSLSFTLFSLNILRCVTVVVQWMNTKKWKNIYNLTKWRHRWMLTKFPFHGSLADMSVSWVYIYACCFAKKLMTITSHHRHLYLMALQPTIIFTFFNILRVSFYGIAVLQISMRIQTFVYTNT